MAVSESDVRHVASLARLVIAPEKLPALVMELNGILEHMEELSAVETTPQVAGTSEPLPTTMRSDVDGRAFPLAVARESFAPEMRDGFFLVPRLAAHEGEGERSP